MVPEHKPTWGIVENQGTQWSAESSHSGRNKKWIFWIWIKCFNHYSVTFSIRNKNTHAVLLSEIWGTSILCLFSKLRFIYYFTFIIMRHCFTTSSNFLTAHHSKHLITQYDIETSRDPLILVKKGWVPCRHKPRTCQSILASGSNIEYRILWNV
jgi:hypothetical protein